MICIPPVDDNDGTRDEGQFVGDLDLMPAVFGDIGKYR
jgi:hypothetical protein